MPRHPIAAAALLLCRLALPAENPIVQIQSLRAQGKLDEAAALSVSALRLSAPALAPRLWNEYGIVLEQQRKFFSSENAFKRSIALWRSAEGDASLNLTWPLDNLGSLYYSAGLFAKSEECRSRALSIRRAALGEHNRDFARTQQNLAAVYVAQGRDAQAQALFEQSLVSLDRLPNAETDRACIRNNLGVLCLKHNRNQDALVHFIAAVDALTARPGPRDGESDATGDATPESRDPLILIHPLGNLGLTYLFLNDATRAEAALKRAVDLSTLRLGADSAETGRILETYATALRSLKRRAEARDALRRSRRIARDRSREDPKTLIVDARDALRQP